MKLAGDTGVFVVGLTGGVGAGKSTVGRRLARAGFPVIDTDRVGHEVLERPEVLVRVAAALGQDVTDGAGKPDRKRIGEIVFSDPDRRAALEEILHPEIAADVTHRIRELGRRGYPVAVLEVPLLVEAGWDKLVDLVVVVDCPPELQVSRYVVRTGAASADGMGRLGAQARRERRLAAADVVIDNSGSLDELDRQVAVLIERLRVTAPDGVS
ncbi:MAG: dephospho-CoA kinase [Deltaproteobacteria bacterium]|nr:dephospho-CoA kinase [Deltaproteobacteria bacterium]